MAMTDNGDFTKEIWKDIPNFEGYQVSNLGRVKSLSKFINNNPKSKSIGYFTKEKILKQFGNTRGYELVKLYNNGEKYTKKIHRLVAEAFIPNPQNKPQVNHIDGNKTNNCVENLEWCTCQENVIHSWENNLQKKKIGQENKLSKKVYQYNLSGELIKIWNCVEDARKTLHISNISMVCCGKRNKAGGFIWRYKND